jgi:phytoene/squalene synthetase
MKSTQGYEMENNLEKSASLASRITKSSSKQTYYTFRLLGDKDYLDDAFRGYAYFRWVDDILDAKGGSKLEKIKFLQRQKGLLRACFQGDFPKCLCPEEEVLADLVRNASPKNPGLKSYLFNMMAVMEFDIHRRHELISQAELSEYSRLLAVAVTDFMHYFIGHDDPTPHHEGRYLAVTAAHITHMLRDSCEDAKVGYFNVPKEFLLTHGITPGEIDHPDYHEWVCQSVRKARELFISGREYLSQVSNLRCRLAGFAYAARFEWMLRVVERENYCLRPDYSDRKGIRASVWIGLKTLSSSLAALYKKQSSSVHLEKQFG